MRLSEDEIRIIKKTAQIFYPKDLVLKLSLIAFGKIKYIITNIDNYLKRLNAK
jgi:hypothetical protein